jgi:hypothetical protein
VCARAQSLLRGHPGLTYDVEQQRRLVALYTEKFGADGSQDTGEAAVAAANTAAIATTSTTSRPLSVIKLESKSTASLLDKLNALNRTSPAVPPGSPSSARTPGGAVTRTATALCSRCEL